jgi:VanZ family protein
MPLPALLRSKWLLLFWFLLMNVLFFLPGSDLPKQGWFEFIPFYDKVVHIGLFGIWIFLSVLALRLRVPHAWWYILGIALVYGMLVEVIQKYWVPNRSFDLFDVLADMIGALSGLLCGWAYIKK